MFTIGEAATATILLPDEQEWQFDYSSETDHADLCTIPLPASETFVAPSNRIGLNGPGKFVSFGRELFEVAERLVGPLIQRSVSDIEAKRWYFPHAPSKTHYETLLPKYGVPSQPHLSRGIPPLRVISSPQASPGRFVPCAGPGGPRARRPDRLRPGQRRHGRLSRSDNLLACKGERRMPPAPGSNQNTANALGFLLTLVGPSWQFSQGRQYWDEPPDGRISSPSYG